MDLPAEPTADQNLEFDCPRCSRPSAEPFYGPCSDCREQLSQLGGAQSEVAATRFEPKMNVVPNAVATKE